MYGGFALLDHSLLLQGDYCGPETLFQIFQVKKGKDNANFKTNGQFSNIWGKERRNREFIFLTSLIS